MPLHSKPLHLPFRLPLHIPIIPAQLSSISNSAEASASTPNQPSKSTFSASHIKWAPLPPGTGFIYTGQPRWWGLVEALATPLTFEYAVAIARMRDWSFPGRKRRDSAPGRMERGSGGEYAEVTHRSGKKAELEEKEVMKINEEAIYSSSDEEKEVKEIDEEGWEMVLRRRRGMKKTKVHIKKFEVKQNRKQEKRRSTVPGVELPVMQSLVCSVQTRKTIVAKRPKNAYEVVKRKNRLPFVVGVWET